MNLEQAMQVLVAAAEAAPLNKAAHVHVEQAVAVVRAALFPPVKEPVNVPAEG